MLQDRVRAAVDRAVRRYKRKKKEKVRPVSFCIVQEGDKHYNVRRIHLQNSLFVAQKVEKMWKEHMADQQRVAKGTGILVLGRCAPNLCYLISATLLIKRSCFGSPFCAPNLHSLGIWCRSHQAGVGGVSRIAEAPQAPHRSRV